MYFVIFKYFYLAWIFFISVLVNLAFFFTLFQLVVKATFFIKVFHLILIKYYILASFKLTKTIFNSFSFN